MGDRRPKIQYPQLPLAFMTEGRGETPDAGHEGTESPTAKRGPEDPATGESLMEEVDSIGLPRLAASSTAESDRTAVVRTRMPGGVGGEEPRGSPLSRSLSKKTHPRAQLERYPGTRRTGMEPRPRSRDGFRAVRARATSFHRELRSVLHR